MKRAWGLMASVACLLVPPLDPPRDPEEPESAEETPPDRVWAALRSIAPTGRVVTAHHVGGAWVTTLLVDDHREDLAFAADGSWLGRARKLTSEAMPTAVRDTVHSRYARFCIWRVEMHQYPVGEVYVVHASHGQERVEACVASDGTVLGERPLPDGQV